MALRWSARIKFSPCYRHAAPLERGIATWRRSLSQSLSIPLISYKGRLMVAGVGSRDRERISMGLLSELYRVRYSLA
jgi:hypothetical protein